MFLIILLLLLLSSLSLYFLLPKLKLFIRIRRLNEPPLVPGHILWGSGAEFSHNAIDFLHRTQKKFGNIFTIRLVHQHLTVIMDPHCYDTLGKTKHLDFDPIQKQVNWNVFGFVLKDARTMIKETGKTVKGNHLKPAIVNFINNLNISFDKVKSKKTSKVVGLRPFVATTVFDAIFNSIFGFCDESVFNSDLVFKNFEIFHKYFNYLWLGMPRSWFPEACKALDQLLLMPESAGLLSRNDLCLYIRKATQYMLNQNQTESDIKGHNLVYLHVNYNTFRLAFWAMYYIMENEEITNVLRQEIIGVCNVDLEEESEIVLSEKLIDEMEILDSVVKETCRISSGVFVVRQVVEDTTFELSDGQVHLLRGGDKVAMYPPAIHKDPTIFENPRTFKFDRFLGNQFFANGKPIKHPVMAFGTLCPGKNFALLQLKLYIISMLVRFDMHLMDKSIKVEPEERYHGHEVLPPKNDAVISVRAKSKFPSISFA